MADYILYNPFKIGIKWKGLTSRIPWQILNPKLLSTQNVKWKQNGG